MGNNIPVNTMYEQRHKFTIVALTGITGSGCSDFADIMSHPFTTLEGDGWGDENADLVRTSTEIISSLKHDKKHDFIFGREFETCRNYCTKQYKEFNIIKYKDIVVFYAIHYISANSATYEEALDRIVAMVSYKFHHSYEGSLDEEQYDYNSLFEGKTIFEWGFTEELFNKLKAVPLDDRDDEYKNIAVLFFDQGFKTFSDTLYEDLKSRDYYSKNFFVHRLASAIRATGNPESKYEDYKSTFTNDYIYTLVDLINHIIKGYHRNLPEKPRRFVIDSIRNSLEILYLRERYNAFYMIAMHNDAHEMELVEKKVAKYAEGDILNKICHNINALSQGEAGAEDFEEGRFYAPDISRCVSESEIHIAYRNKSSLNPDAEDIERGISTLTFYTYAEQWMKFFSLISRPGIITPSRDERCMSMAYVAKFNSGCISRQVGCAIVDKESAVQSIGWNDPPSAQIPCNLRFADELIDKAAAEKINGSTEDVKQYRVYSKFEMTDSCWYGLRDKDGKVIKTHGVGFCECMKNSIGPKVIPTLQEEGLNFPYCFRTNYNRFKDNKDGVNTRSLHAEENTMLRIAHRGGIGLDGGTMYVTASPCVLCSKKAYQIGIKDIVYLDPYTDIAPDLIIHCGFGQPRLRVFTGAIGSTFYKLYQPFLPLKDELKIYSDTLNNE